MYSALANALGGDADPALIKELPDGVVIDLTGSEPRVIYEERLLGLDESLPSRPSRVAVRCFDIIGALMIGIVAAPVALACAVLVRITSRGPVIYGSPRHGHRGTTFDALKFRSMRTNGDEILTAHFAENPDAQREYAENFKLKVDPRITSVGNILRKSSLDELPQLLNVVRGEMSLVGPRPKLLNEAERYGPALPTVLRVKPGLTGKWQTSGRSNLGFAERIILDVEYATTRTLAEDVKICLKTAVQMLRPGQHGAY